MPRPGEASISEPTHCETCTWQINSRSVTGPRGIALVCGAETLSAGYYVGDLQEKWCIALAREPFGSYIPPP